MRTLEAAGAKAVFVEDPAMLAALRGAPVRHWILLTGGAEGALTLEDLREMGRAAMARDPELLARLRAETQPSDPAVLYLTSGATGEPKMALVTHQAIVSNIDMGPRRAAPRPGGRHGGVSALRAHRAARGHGVPAHALRHAGDLLREPAEAAAGNPQGAAHHSAGAAAHVGAHLLHHLHGTAQAPGGRRARRFTAAWRWRWPPRATAARASPCRCASALPLKVADRLFFRKVRARFGGRLRVAASGAAPLGKDLAEFYEAIGMPIIEGYGLTEGGVVALNPLDAPRPGSIGKALAPASSCGSPPMASCWSRAPACFPAT